MIRIAVVGFGYWGPNIVRNFSRQPGANVVWVCDVVPKTIKDLGHQYPTIKTTTNYQTILNDKTIDAVVIVTPISTHFMLAKAALAADKHVLVEKPMTKTPKEAATLVTLARAKKKILMVDHTFLYTPAVRYLKKLIAKGTLGEIYAVDSVRTNLGLIQQTNNVVEDLAVHDFSIIDYLFGYKPKTLSVTGIEQKEIHQETVAHISATYEHDLFVHTHISWLSPMKIRRMIFTGTKKMVVYDDIEPSEKIKIFDKSISFVKNPKQSFRLRIGYRNGDILIPELPLEEGLFNMTAAFLKVIRTGKPSVSDGTSGARVVRYLELATKSLRANGKIIRI